MPGVTKPRLAEAYGGLVFVLLLRREVRKALKSGVYVSRRGEMKRDTSLTDSSLCKMKMLFPSETFVESHTQCGSTVSLCVCVCESLSKSNLHGIFAKKKCACYIY